jgi:anti-sigma factor RsiW
MNLSCGQIEERLSDYIEKSLSIDDTRELEIHLAECPKCVALEMQMRYMLGALARMDSELEIPPELTGKILEQTFGPRKSNRGAGVLAWLKALWKPQVLVGVAGALATLLIVTQFMLPARMRVNGTTPVGIMRSANRQAHLVYARGVKYMNDLRVVYEIQSRLRNEPEPSPGQPGMTAPQGPNDRTEEQRPGHSANRTVIYQAVMLIPMPMARRSLR